MKLEIGYNHPFEIRTEQVSVAIDAELTIIHITDLHFTGYSVDLVNHLSKSIEELNPDIILLGGDYADSKKGLALLSTFLKTIAVNGLIFAIPGNHDYYWNLKKIRQVMVDNNVTWLDNESEEIKIRNITIHIDGGTPKNEKKNSDLSILLLHQPIDVYPFKDNYNLILAGHLHGCQFVLWETNKGLYPGRIFYKWNFLKKLVDDCLYLVSKGIGDTLPIRYNCKKDIIFVKVSPDLEKST